MDELPPPEQVCSRTKRASYFGRQSSSRVQTCGVRGEDNAKAESILPSTEATSDCAQVDKRTTKDSQKQRRRLVSKSCAATHLSARDWVTVARRTVRITSVLYQRDASERTNHSLQPQNSPTVDSQNKRPLVDQTRQKSQSNTSQQLTLSARAIFAQQKSRNDTNTRREAFFDRYETENATKHARKRRASNTLTRDNMTNTARRNTTFACCLAFSSSSFEFC